MKKYLLLLALAGFVFIAAGCSCQSPVAPLEDTQTVSFEKVSNDRPGEPALDNPIREPLLDGWGDSEQGHHVSMTISLKLDPGYLKPARQDTNVTLSDLKAMFDGDFNDGNKPDDK